MYGNNGLALVTEGFGMIMMARCLLLAGNETDGQRKDFRARVHNKEHTPHAHTQASLYILFSSSPPR